MVLKQFKAKHISTFIMKKEVALKGVCNSPRYAPYAIQMNSSLELFLSQKFPDLINHYLYGTN